MNSLCVFTGSNRGVRSEYANAARELGLTLAERKISLVYGGGRVGLMGVIADAVLTSGGNVIGVIPEALMAKEVGHGAVSELRVVKTMHERKALMADLAEGFVAMPGGWGTLDEFFEILTWAQLGLHRKPCGMLNIAGYFDRLLAFLDYAVAEGFVKPQHRAMICVASEPSELLDLLANHKPPVVEKWINRAEA